MWVLRTFGFLLAFWGCAFALDTYRVQPKDTLTSISKVQGVSVSQLRAWNELKTDSLKPGQILKLSAGEFQTLVLGDVRIVAPRVIRPGDAFSIKVWGKDSGSVKVNFSSELEDAVRFPGESLIGTDFIKGGYVVLGRAALQTQAQEIVLEAHLGRAHVRGTLALEFPEKPLAQGLKFSQSTTATQTQWAEDSDLEKAYGLRTPKRWTEPFVVPISGAVSVPFGAAVRYSKSGPVLFGRAVVFTPSQSDVLAVNAGTVVLADRYPNRAGLVAIDHGLGVLSVYFGQSQVSVAVGDSVVRGQKIGEVSGPNGLQWEMRLRGEATNPLAWVNQTFPK